MSFSRLVRRRPLGLALAISLSALVAVTPPAGASPTPTPGVAGKQVDRSAAPTSGHQDAQEALWEDLQHYVTNGKIRGLAGGSFEADGRTLTVYWAGEPPTALTAIAQRHAATAVMSMVSVPYDKQEIAARAKRLIAAAKQQGIPLGGVSSTRDFRGLRAKVEPSATATQRNALRELGAAEVVNGGGKPVPLVRYADTPDFWGGAVIKRPLPGGSNQVCSTGWAVKNSAGNKSMLTTRHCGPNQDWTTYSNNLFVGRSNSGHSGTDSMRLTGAGYSNLSYVGPWNSSSGRQNNGAADVALNSTICASGALSGEVCNGRVDQVNAFDSGGTGPGFWASATQGLTGLAGQGDSGGPAYSYSATGRLILRGMIVSSELQFSAACPGGDSNPWNTGSPRRLCFTPVFFTNQSAIHAALGVTPILS